MQLATRKLGTVLGWYLGKLSPEFVFSRGLWSFRGWCRCGVGLGLVLSLLGVFLSIGRLGGWLHSDGSFCRLFIACEEVNFFLLLGLRLTRSKLLSVHGLGGHTKRSGHIQRIWSHLAGIELVFSLRQSRAKMVVRVNI